MNENRNTTATGNILQQWYFSLDMKKGQPDFWLPQIMLLRKGYHLQSVP